MIKRSHSIQELKDAHLHCRVFGHGWDSAHDAPIIQTVNDSGRKIWTVTVACSCETTRTDELDQGTLEVDRRVYDYPDGYLTSFILDRTDARREWVARKNKVTSIKSRRRA